MPFFICIIYSRKLDKYYIGYTDDLPARLAQHNNGISTFTAKAADWILKWSEQQPAREAAMQREKQIKQKKSRKYIEWLISSVE